MPATNSTGKRVSVASGWSRRAADEAQHMFENARRARRTGRGSRGLANLDSDETPIEQHNRP
jgi:hypothetical protein